MAQQGTVHAGRRYHSSPSCPWPLLSKEELEGDTPSRLQGMPAKRERTIMGSLTKMLRQTGEAARAKALRRGPRSQPYLPCVVLAFFRPAEAGVTLLVGLPLAHR